MDTRAWLLLTVGVTACLWAPYVLDRFVRLGIPRTLGNPKPSDPDELSPWARRAQRAHANAVENLVVFAPLAVMAVHSGVGGTALASGASAAYFYARLAHYLLHAGGVPVLRTVAFLAGFGAQLALLAALVGTGSAP